jgi:hypothetical protein
VTITSVDAARECVQAKRPELLLGAVECAWLEVKAQPYRLDDPSSVAELLKDVAGLANASGGLLLIGYKTRPHAGGEMIDAIRPVPASMVDTDRCRKLLRERVSPHVRGLRLEWIEVSDGEGVLAIDVPKQAETNKPFTVPGPTAAKGSPSVAVPVRDGDATVWLPRAELQRLLGSGWRGEGLGRGITNAIRHATSSTAQPADLADRRNARVGEGAPDPAPFERAVAAAGGAATVGRPASEVEQLGPGHAQRIHGVPGQEGHVVCLLPGRSSAAVVPLHIWRALEAIGGEQNHAGVAAAGFPVDRKGQDGPLLVPSEATFVDLDGGSWGPGRIKRPDATGRWTWEPTPRVAFEVRHNRLWLTAEPVDLRLRAVADLPWLVREAQPEITRARRARLRAALATAELSNAIPALSGRRGATLTAQSWATAVGEDSHQSDRAAQFRSLLVSPKGVPAVSANVILQLPAGPYESSVLGIAELRVRFAAWRAAMEGVGAAVTDDTDLRLSVPEVVEALVSAWDTAAMIAPLAAAEDPPAVLLGGPPFVEMHVKAGPEVPTSFGDPQRGLRDVVDLSALGEPTRDDMRTETGFRAVAPLGIGRQERLGLVVSGLVRLAHSWGYIDADSNDLLARVGSLAD